MTPPTHEIVTYRDADVVEAVEFGRKNWRLGERVQWYVAILDGQVIGRRRTRDEVVELLRSKQISKS